MDLLNPKLKSNIWYYHIEQNNYMIYFMATLQNGMVDAIAINKGKVNKGRTSLAGLASVITSKKIIEAPNQEVLNVLYGP